MFITLIFNELGESTTIDTYSIDFQRIMIF